MLQRVLTCSGIVLAILALTAATGSAQQQSDSEWLAQCREQRGDRARYCEVRPLTPGAGLLRIDSRPNGGVQVTGSDQGVASGSARIQAQADSEQAARDIAAQIRIETGAFIRADGPSTNGGSWSVSFVLSVPRFSDLEIDAVNGPVSVRGVHGQIRATTVNGPMSLRGLGGDVHARSTNGPLEVVLAGAFWEGTGLDAETRNGPATVRVPDGYSAEIDMATVNGPLRLGVPITVQGTIPAGRQRSIKTALGSGGAPIKVRTTNGPLSIQQNEGH
jgi:DUF4097 and DUF4098 domain-containing protein YvlB